MLRFGITITLLLGTCFNANAQKPFLRVEEFPPGEQGSSLASLVKVNDLHTEAVMLKAPYAATWSAVKAAAQKLDKIGGRPIVGVSEQSGRIQNGKIQLESMELSGKMLDFRDEFITEVTAIDAQTTKLSVTRKVVKKTIGSSRWQQNISNGKIERWLITQVIDGIKNPTSASAQVSQSSVTSTFVSKDSAGGVLELREDKTFLVNESGRQMSGTYEWAGDSLTLIVGASRFTGKLAGDILTDNEGKLWMRKGAAPLLPASTDGTGELIGNADIIKLVQAKLPDSIILGKIKNSPCRFDLSTDALIKLKEATVSDAIIQAMADAPKK